MALGVLLDGKMTSRMKTRELGVLDVGLRVEGVRWDLRLRYSTFAKGIMQKNFKIFIDHS